MEMMGIFTKLVSRCFANRAKDSQSCRFCREFPKEPGKGRGLSSMQEMAQNSSFASFPSRLCSAHPAMALANCNLAGRARSQFRTGMVCHRFFPDPPGNVFAVNFSESFLFVAKCAPGRARGGRLWRAGARHSAPPRSASLLPFLPKQERKAPGRGRGAPGL